MISEKRLCMAAVNWQKTKACVNPMMLTRTFLSLFRFYLDFSLVITILEVNYMPCASVWICMTYLRVFQKNVPTKIWEIPVDVQLGRYC